MFFYRTICSFYLSHDVRAKGILPLTWYLLISIIYFAYHILQKVRRIFAISTGDLPDSVKTLFIMLSYKSIHKNIRFFHLFMIYLLLSPSFSVTQTYLWHSLQAHNIIRFTIYQLNSAFRRLAADLQNIFTWKDRSIYEIWCSDHRRRTWRHFLCLWTDEAK